MKLSCDEATKICDKSQYGEITFLEKAKLIWHIFLCKNCGRYSKQNSIMSKCYSKQQHFEKNKKCCLSENEKDSMEKDIKDKI